jgi:drug/metabolite transporter (DMT)-like permease
MRRSSPQLGYALALAGASMFAWLGPLSRWAEADDMQLIPFVAWRAGMGALLLAAVVGIRAVLNGTVVPRPPAREIATLLLATVIALVLNVAIFGAFTRVTIAIALLGLYTYPAMVAAVALVTGNERATPGTITALLVALGGMALVLIGGIDTTQGVTLDAVGVGLALLAAACQTVFITISRRGYTTIPADRAMGVILAGTAVGCAAIVLATGDATELTMPFGQPDLLLILITAGTFGAGIASLFFLSAVRLIGGMRTGILMLFEPVVAVTLAAVLLHEAIRPLQVLGAIGVLSAALLLRRSAAADEDATTEARTTADDDLVGIGVPGGP